MVSGDADGKLVQWDISSNAFKVLNVGSSYCSWDTTESNYTAHDLTAHSFSSAVQSLSFMPSSQKLLVTTAKAATLITDCDYAPSHPQDNTFTSSNNDSIVSANFMAETNLLIGFNVINSTKQTKNMANFSV